MTTVDSRFYGYKHWTREPVPRCFYVGKGTKRRPFDHTVGKRSKKWLAVVERYGLTVEVCLGPTTDPEVKNWEVAQIQAEGTYSKCTSLRSLEGIGCNFTLGGEGAVGVARTPEQKAAIGNRFRKPKTPEHREKLRLANLGKRQSQESIEKTRRSKLGRPLSEQNRRNLWANRERRHSLSHKIKLGQPVYQVDPITFEPMIAWLSMAIAAENVGAPSGLNISAAAQRKCKARGYYWVYAKKTPQERPWAKKSNR